MCGIVGCLLNGPLVTDDLVRMRTLRDRLAHRGPDDVDEWYDRERGIYLGHRRLSIIDLENSAQPMQRGDAVITYNGEVYNYVELAADLEAAGFYSQSHGDTEVVLNAWRAWGEHCLDRFDGMFAFALIDRDGLHLATDPFGEKPIYLLHTERGLVFSSEAASLIEVFDLQFTPDDDELAEFLYLGYIRPPGTGYVGLQVLPPSTIMSCSRDGRIQQRRYWSMPEPVIGRGLVRPVDEKFVDRIGEVLTTSLERRMRADVPLGLFLSGGVDSSLVAALAARELQASLETLTVSFPDGADESSDAARIAAHLGLPHSIINSTGDESWRETPEALAGLYGVPNDNITVLAVYQLCRAAHSRLKVALSGIGGDELFYGYNKHGFFYRHRLAYSIAPWLMKILTPFDDFLKCIGGRRWRQARDLFSGTQERQYLRIKNGACQNSLEAALGRNAEAFLPAGTSSLVHRVRNHDLLSSMPQSYIPAVERGSMRASLEVRAPFLTRDLVVLLSELDARALVAFGLKGVTRRLLSRYLPLKLLSRKKQGFVFPAARYLSSRDDRTPVVPGVDESHLSALWADRLDSGTQAIAIRLALIEYLATGKKT